MSHNFLAISPRSLGEGEEAVKPRVKDAVCKRNLGFDLYYILKTP